MWCISSIKFAAKPDPFDFQVVIPPETAVGDSLELSVVFKANPQITDLVWLIPDLDEPLYAIPLPENRTEVETRDESLIRSTLCSG